MNTKRSIEIYQELRILAKAYNLDERQIYMILSLCSPDTQYTPQRFPDLLASKFHSGNIRSMLTFQYGKTLELVKEILNNAEGRLKDLMENQRTDLLPLLTESSRISQNRNIIKIVHCNEASLSHTIVANQMAPGKRVPEEDLLSGSSKKQKN